MAVITRSTPTITPITTFTMKSKILLTTLLLLGCQPWAMAQPVARIQFIHNSADLTLSNVDIWMDATQLVDNLPFREATSYLDLPASVPLSIGIAPENSSSEQ